MKKILHSIFCIAPLLLFFACSPYDNYEGPKETFRGRIIDKATGQNMPTEHTNDNGTRIKLMEYSWSDTPSPFYFACKADGTFQHTKLFKGTYGVTVFGPFVPIPEVKNVEIKGVVEMDFQVEPFLRITMIGTPVKNADRTITFKYKVERGTSNPDYQQTLKEVNLYGNTNPFTSQNDGDVGEYTVRNTSATNSMLGQELTVTSKAIPAGRNTVFFRIGARIDKQIEGVNRYNYTPVVRVDF